MSSYVFRPVYQYRLACFGRLPKAPQIWGIIPISFIKAKIEAFLNIKFCTLLCKFVLNLMEVGIVQVE
jgi:hypothetical protein